MDGHGMLKVHQAVEEEKEVLEEYVKDSEENALKLVYNMDLLNWEDTKMTYKKDLIYRWNSKN